MRLTWQSNLMDWVSRDISMQWLMRWRKWLFLPLIIAAPLFFVGGPSAYSLDIYRRLWDLGHPCFFAILSLLLIAYGIIKNPRHFLLAVCCVFFSSLAIEKVQSYVGREASWIDVLSNVSGFLLGGIFLFSSVVKRLAVVIMMLLGLVPSLAAVIKATMVCWTLWQQFPVLLSGNSNWEAHAWGNQIYLAPLQTGSGYQLNFDGEAYASADMMGFIQSWNGYTHLVLELENPGKPFELVLRISDKQHEMSEQNYNDRYNGRVAIASGYQKISLALKDIEGAPKNRAMNLGEIYLLKLFLPRDGDAQVILLKKIYLK